MSWLLTNLILPIIGYLLPIVENDLINWFKKQWAAYQQKKIDAKNVQALKDAQATGDQDAVAKAGENTLNGDAP